MPAASAPSAGTLSPGPADTQCTVLLCLRSTCGGERGSALVAGGGEVRVTMRAVARGPRPLVLGSLAPATAARVHARQPASNARAPRPARDPAHLHGPLIHSALDVLCGRRHSCGCLLSCVRLLSCWIGVSRRPAGGFVPCGAGGAAWLRFGRGRKFPVGAAYIYGPSRIQRALGGGLCPGRGAHAEHTPACASGSHLARRRPVGANDQCNHDHNPWWARGACRALSPGRLGRFDR